MVAPRMIAPLAILLFIATIVGIDAASQVYMVPMRDGVKLHTVVDFPLGMMEDPNGVTKPLPACYVVSPYGHGRNEMIADVRLFHLAMFLTLSKLC
jgi:predicted acyl esterase